MRSRNLKPGFFKNDELGRLAPLARLLYAGLWCLADRCGRLKDRPAMIRAEVLPYDECNIDDLLHALHEGGFIIRYEAEGTKCIEIPKFVEHQNPHHREAESVIPKPQPSLGLSPDFAGTSRADSLFSDSLFSDSGDSFELNRSKPTTAANARQDPRTARACEQAEADGDRVVMTFPVVGSAKMLEWTLREGQLAKYAVTFQGLDVLAECRKALLWIQANPLKRKTARGMQSFLFRWLERAQNSGVRGPPSRSVVGAKGGGEDLGAMVRRLEAERVAEEKARAAK